MILFVLFVFFIFIISRLTVNEMFLFLMRLFKNKPLAFSIISIFFLPGTIVHETAHFLTALILLLPVKKMSVFPIFENNEIKLGGVTFERRDFIRSAIVGIAPFFIGISMLFLMFSFSSFFQTSILLKIIFYYLVFAISSNMFSSKKDLEDLALIIPIIVLVFIIFYILGLKINIIFENKTFTNGFNAIMNKANYYFFLVLIVQITLFSLFKIINHFKKK